MAIFGSLRKTPKERVWRASGVGEHVQMWGEGCTGEGMGTPPPAPIPCLCIASTCCSELQPFTLNQWSREYWVAVSSMSLSSRFIRFKERGSWEPPLLQAGSPKHSWQLGLETGLWSGAGVDAQPLRTEPSTCCTWNHLPVNSVRIELSSWCSENYFVEVWYSVPHREIGASQYTLHLVYKILSHKYFVKSAQTA